MFASIVVALKDPGGAMIMFFVILSWGLFLGYVVGFLPAIATGLVACLLHFVWGRFSWVLAGALGLASGVAFSLLSELPMLDAPPRYAGDYAMMIVTCWAPTVLCWRLASAILERRAALAAQET
jgi:hypothetical protein